MTALHNYSRRQALLCATALGSALLLFPVGAYAGGSLPSGGQYVAGKGAIGGTAGSLTVSQSSATGIIDWNSFSIGKSNSVTFNNGTGATLNEVTGRNLSTIAGSLHATGSVYLIDPEGIVVSGSGKIVTGGSFIASTRDISHNAFMAGGAAQFSGTSSGNVTNQGSITSLGGDAVLVGNSVSNTGSLTAANGTAALGAGNDVLLQPADGSNRRLFVSGGKGNVSNAGTIKAASVELAAANGNVYALAGNRGSLINATGTNGEQEGSHSLEAASYFQPVS
jgi:filamentous hemagglutinin family protein